MLWWLILIIGVAAEVVGMALPQYWPDAPQWIWGTFVWGGIAVIIGALVWGFVGQIRDRAKPINRKPIYFAGQYLETAATWARDDDWWITLGNELRQAALDGSITVWGRRPYYTLPRSSMLAFTIECFAVR